MSLTVLTLVLYIGHLALISSNPGGVGGALGVLTLEDVIEELIGEVSIGKTLITHSSSLATS